MTSRDAFLATIRARPRGHDPGLPARDAPPDAPTELRPGEDPLERFRAEAEAVAGIVTRVEPSRVAAAVVDALVDADAHLVALADDLGPHREAVRRACDDAGLEVVGYGEVAADRERAGALDATVTGCLAAVAATGSIVTSAAGAGRAGALIAPTHVCVVRAEQVVPGFHALMTGSALEQAGSLFALQSGPSRSADIEKTLILGVHGPGRVHVVLAA
jgi:L-lactate utilization protein LutC